MKHVFVASADVGANAAEDSPHVGGEDAPKHRRLASPSTQGSSKAAAGAQAAVGATASPDGTGYLGMQPTAISEWPEPESLQRFLSEPP